MIPAEPLAESTPLLTGWFIALDVSDAAIFKMDPYTTHRHAHI